MQLYSFVYNKENGEPVRRRFVACTNYDSLHLYGYDLEDGVQKTFLRSRSTEPATNHGTFDENLLRNSYVVDKQYLFDFLGWTSTEKNVFESLEGTDQQLSKVVSAKTGDQIIPLVEGKFLVIPKPSVTVNLDSDGTKVKLIIKPGLIEYTDSSGRPLTVEEFTGIVLGLK